MHKFMLKKIMYTFNNIRLLNICMTLFNIYAVLTFVPHINNKSNVVKPEYYIYWANGKVIH